MTLPQPSLRVPLNPANPGQFFACCGLFELADRLWPRTVAWFDLSDSAFSLACPGAADNAGKRLLGELLRCDLTNTMTPAQLHRREELPALIKNEEDKAKREDLEKEKKHLDKLHRESPIVLHDPFHLRIDWFLDSRSGGDRFKTWAGQQSVFDIAKDMRDALTAGAWPSLPPDQWLTQPSATSGPPFNFDSDLGDQGSAIDLGFSFDPLKISPHARPLVELGTFIGLQRFRPRPHGRENLYTFVLWPNPTPLEIAAVAACGLMPVPGGAAYDFRLLYRTKYLKSFLPAQPNRGHS